MAPDSAAELVQSAVWTAMLLGLPILAVVFLVSLLVNVVQTATQLQDQTLSIVPRLLAAGTAVLILLPWLLGRLADYSTDLYTSLPGG